VGDYALSGDVYYVCLDDSMAYAAVTSEGQYMYTYHGPQIEKAVLSAAQSIGEYAFAYCRQMTQVVLNDSITEIPQYAFAGCIALKDIDLSKIVTVGDYAFIESEALETVDMSAAETVGEYAFVYGKALRNVKLNPNGTDLDEAAFAYCDKLTTVENLGSSKNIGDYCFAYTAMVEADLSGAVSIGSMAFLKEKLTPFKVTLGNALESLGDNPFAMCKVEPFHITEVKNFNGVDYVTKIYTYDLSDNVFVIDGSLYCKIKTGLELITYAGVDHTDVKVADGTVRITSMAFAGSDVKMVTLPYTVGAIGHKAFYQCDDLKTVVFNSYNAPILEEEFDSAYYETYKHIPGTGDFGTYTDYDGNDVQINGMGMLPYFMWNATDGMYSNVFYGANFVDYVGYVDNKLTMVRPVNGQYYETYVLDQYFDLRINGAAGADDVTLEAIAAINAIPERVAYEDKEIVEAARAAYDKIATTEQQALVTNYSVLVAAEQRIIALTPTEDETDDDTKPAGHSWLVWLMVALGVAGVAGVCVFGYLQEHPIQKKEKAPVETEAAEEAPAEETEPQEETAEEDIFFTDASAQKPQTEQDEQ